MRLGARWRLRSGRAAISRSATSRHGRYAVQGGEQAPVAAPGDVIGRNQIPDSISPALAAMAQGWERMHGAAPAAVARDMLRYLPF
jgi:hypothetical protein